MTALFIGWNSLPVLHTLTDRGPSHWLLMNMWLVKFISRKFEMVNQNRTWIIKHDNVLRSVSVSVPRTWDWQWASDHEHFHYWRVLLNVEYGIYMYLWSIKSVWLSLSQWSPVWITIAQNKWNFFTMETTYLKK